MNEENKNYYAENCRICKSPFKKEHHFREMMFGFRDEFRYQECSSCGCLQIAELPVNLTSYYPSYYYSFKQIIPSLKRFPLMKRLFSGFRLKKKYKKNCETLKYLKYINTGINDKILDVGCGKGALICQLFNHGFENIQGIDKFLPEEVDHGYGVKVMKKDLFDLQANSYDLIMMHHVLEHMDQQKEVLLDCYKLLKKKGCLMIRIPVIGEVWESYQDNWIQLDAPRHFFLHTLKSMEILANQAGFEIRQTIFDSTGFQFWGSELYKRDIPLFTSGSDSHIYPIERIFSKTQLQTFEQDA